MTDNEIIKALECCIADKCMECPLRKIPKVKGCMNRLSFALDLIKRQQAEIERLRDENNKLKLDMSYMIKPNTIGNVHEMGAW